MLDAVLAWDTTDENVIIQRWRCIKCGKCSDETPPGGRKGSIASITLRDAVAVACFESGFAKAGTLFGIDPKTARARWNEWAETRERSLPQRVPEHIGLHVAIVGGGVATLVTDVLSCTVVEVLLGASEEVVTRWLERIGDAGSIRAVTLSMHQPFRDAMARLPRPALETVCPQHCKEGGLSSFLAAFRTVSRKIGRDPRSNVRERPRIFATPASDLSPAEAEDMLAWDDSILVLYHAKESFMAGFQKSRSMEVTTLLAAAETSCRAVAGASRPVTLIQNWGGSMASGAGDPRLEWFSSLLTEMASAWRMRHRFH